MLRFVGATGKKNVAVVSNVSSCGFRGTGLLGTKLFGRKMMSTSGSAAKGRFIVFEGLDGCGKGTQMKLCATFLFDESKDYDVYMTREPTRDFKQLREAMAKGENVKRDAEWYAKTFVQDRHNHLQNYIVPALERGTHVLCDRFKHSTLAYQHTQGLPLEQLVSMHEGMPAPDLTFIFDCPAEVAFERRQKDNATDVFEKDKEFQRDLRENYLKPVQDIAEQVRQHIRAVLQKPDQ
ncbi:Thymidylate kinase [Balamuthia mandrillaris]